MRVQLVDLYNIANLSRIDQHKLVNCLCGHVAVPSDRPSYKNIDFVVAYLLLIIYVIVKTEILTTVGRGPRLSE